MLRVKGAPNPNRANVKGSGSGTVKSSRFNFLGFSLVHEDHIMRRPRIERNVATYSHPPRAQYGGGGGFCERRGVVKRERFENTRPANLKHTKIMKFANLKG